MKCLNCDQETEGNYCTSCGQKISTERFSFKRALRNGILSGIFMVDRGYFFTMRGYSAGHGIREYLEGKRIGYFNPFSLLFILIAIAF